MSGILGIWNLDGQPVDKAALARMSATIAHRGPDGEGFWIQGPIGLGCQLFRVTPESLHETQPLVDASGCAIVFDGRLDNRDELLASIDDRRDVSADSPDPVLVREAYRAFGEGFAERLNGDFALGLFDPKEPRLILARDAIGVRPLYYCRAGNAFLFASEIKALLAHSQVFTRPNDDVLAEFLLGGPLQYDLGETFFSGVSTVVPGHLAISTPGRFMTRRYWDFDLTPRVHHRSFHECAEEFRHHFERAVERRLRSASPVAVAVSGGLDSSSILCLAETLRRRAPDRHPRLLGISLTSPDGSPSDEKTFLLDIERGHDIAVTRIPLRPPQFLKGSKEALRNIEAPFLRTPWNTTHVFYDVAREKGARVVLTGQWGDQILTGREYLIDLVDRLEWSTAWAQLNEYGRWFTDVNPKLAKRDFLQQLVRYYVPDAVRPILRRLRAKVIETRPTRSLYSAAFRKRTDRCASRNTTLRKPFNTAYANSIYQMARSWYYVQCMDWNNKAAAVDGMEMAYPFFDRDLISFMLGIPGEVRSWKGVPKAILREAMKGVLPETIRERRWKADATDLLNESMENQYQQLVDCIQSGGMALRMGYVNGDVMAEELLRLGSRIRGPANAVTWSLGELLGLELWLQVFFSDRNEAVNATERRTSEHAIQGSTQGSTE